MKTVILLLSLFLLFANCSSDQPAASGAIETVDEVGLKNLIADRGGNILVLNVWATWCIPCREEFPDLVRLANDFKNQNIELIGLSVDYPDEIQSTILPFIKKEKVNFKIIVQDFEDEGRMITLLHPDWQGALPATFIFDSNGRLLNFFQGKQNYKSLKSAIEQAQELVAIDVNKM